MAVNALKIRLGAPDSMILFGGQANSVDLGASVGGATLTYNPTNFQVEIDQALSPVQAFRTKEECTFGVAVVQEQVSMILASFSYNTTGVATVAAGTLAAGPTPTLVVNGATGSATVSYQVVPYNYNGDAVPGTAGTTSTANAALGPVNSITLTWAAAQAGIAGYKIIRSAGGGTQGLIATVPPSITTFTDTGLPATAYTPSGAAPVTPSVDTGFFGGTVALQQGAFDWSVPKNDGTTNKWQGHLNKVYSSKQIALDWARDKVTEINKFELAALADLTQPAGQQLGYLRELY